MTQSKYLYLMRHGEAQPQSRVGDFERALTSFGKRQIISQTEQFKTQVGIRPDGAFCSTAKRARETAEELQKLFKGIPFFYRETLYLAPTRRLMELIHDTDDLFQRILIIGHNPGLEQLAGLLDSKGAFVPISPADCVVIRLDVDSWKAVKAASGKIEKIFLGRI